MTSTPVRTWRSIASFIARSSTRLNSASVSLPSSCFSRASFRYSGRNRLPTTSLRNTPALQQPQNCLTSLLLLLQHFKALFGNQHGRQTKEQNLKRDSPIRTLKGKFISTLLILSG